VLEPHAPFVCSFSLKVSLVLSRLEVSVRGWLAGFGTASLPTMLAFFSACSGSLGFVIMTEWGWSLRDTDGLDEEGLELDQISGSGQKKRGEPPGEAGLWDDGRTESSRVHCSGRRVCGIWRGF
jgi:hypothetical protein